jgi:hypothetical protein
MSQSLADLTPTMQAMLIRALTQGVDLDDPRARTIRALEARGLIHQRTSGKGRTSWRTTATGYSVVVLDAPCCLAARSEYGYTHRDGAGEPHGYRRYPITVLPGAGEAP